MKPAATVALLLFVAAVSWPQTPLKQRTEKKDGRRLALLVGNQRYSKLKPLAAVESEVDLVREALMGAAFEITPVKDANYEALRKALESFVAAVKPGDICFVYYSGYAAQNGDDDYLLPTDFDPTLDTLDNKVAYPVTALARNLEVKQAGIKMFFLEGARNFESSLSTGAPGLRIPYTGDVKELLFAIPNLANPTIDSAPDPPGLFTQALVEVMNGDKPLSDLMPQVQKMVMEQSKDRQQPDYQSKVTQPFYFHKPHVRSQNTNDREFYVWVPPGNFKMGCVPGVKCDKDEEPQHEVRLRHGFWMGENEVRVVSYKNFVTDGKKPKDGKRRKMPPAYTENPGWKNEEHPIANVSWEDAKNYCSWAGGRLPTEAEWERAARGGKDNRIYPFDSFEESTKNAMFFGNVYYKYTAPAQKFNKNEYGLFDMSGNVWELVSDYFGPYSASPVVDPKGPATGKSPVQRGGSYDSDPKKHLRISYREPFKKPWPNIGFRCVMDDTPHTEQLLQIP
jgi:sulfatase modifying factor 1